jgi:ribonuclease PH
MAHRHNREHEIPELLERILWAQRKLKEAQEQIMIDQSVFDAALAATNTAVTNAVAAIAAGTPGTSTPDATVNAFLTGLGSAVQTLVAGTPPVASTPAAKPA